MVATRKPQRAPSHPSVLPDRFRAQLAANGIPLGSRLCVALSGGLDSVTLLHLLHALRHQYDLTAIHVHHGLSKNADHWQDFCRCLCANLGIALECTRVSVAPDDPAGLEAAARTARYNAFARLDSDYVVLAHHQDDQAETLLLQLLRGAGPKGLSGMPVLKKPATGPMLLRPLLHVTRQELQHWAQQQSLTWIEDESNQDTHLERNFLRHSIFPRIAIHYPGYRQTLTRASQLLAETAELVDELAHIDAQHIIHQNRLDCLALANLSPARASNVLRSFFANHQLPTPSAARLGNTLKQLLTSRPDSMLRLDFDGQSLRRYRNFAWFVPNLDPIDSSNCWLWQGESILKLPALHGELHFTQTTEAGHLRLPANQVLRIRPRQGGEKLRLSIQRPDKPLKDWLQASGIPPWERPYLPLIWYGEHLVHVPNIGTACDWQTTAGELGIRIEWRWPIGGKPSATHESSQLT